MDGVLYGIQNRNSRIVNSGWRALRCELKFIPNLVMNSSWSQCGSRMLGLFIIYHKLNSCASWNKI